jgi:hypothetical protein
MKFAFSRRRAYRAYRIGAMAFACLIAVEPSAPAAGGGLPDFFSNLFGGAPPPDQPSKPTPPQAPHRARKRPREAEKPRDFVPANETRAPGAPGGDPVQVSFYVDVIGDSLATLTAEGLVDALEDRREVAVVNKSREASGLVRDDYFDWPKSATELSHGKDKVNFVVAMLGINDLQSMRDGSESLDPLGDRWLAKYRQRVAAVVAPFQAAKIPLAWVGLPPMRSEKFNAAAIKLNQIYKEQAENAGDKYIDIWDAFTDQNGQYDAFGPNVDGQSVKLRGPDGIHFTKAGERKVAHFVEAEIRRAFEKTNPPTDAATLPPDIEHAADDINSEIRREMGAPQDAELEARPKPEPKPLAGPILSLTAMPLSPGGVLAIRESKDAKPTDEAARVFRSGDPPAARAGRADDFAWPRF